MTEALSLQDLLLPTHIKNTNDSRLLWTCTTPNSGKNDRPEDKKCLSTRGTPGEPNLGLSLLKNVVQRNLGKLSFELRLFGLRQ